VIRNRKKQKVITYLEKWGAWGFAIAGLVVATFIALPFDNNSSPIFGIFLGSAISVGVILASLTGVSTAALISAKKDLEECVARILYGRLMSYVLQSALASLFLVILAFIGFFLIDAGDVWMSIYKHILVAAICLSLGMFLRSFMMLTRIGRYFPPPTDPGE